MPLDQLEFFELAETRPAPTKVNYDEYDTIIVTFSGGKDSLATVLYLIDIGVDRDKIELWHHNVDGAPGSEHFMDWPVTPDYCRKVARHLNVPIYFSWKNGGFKGELHRENQRTQPTSFETPYSGIITVGGKHGKIATRKRFPQVSADLKVRYCSPYLKIDVGATAITNQPRFTGPTKTLVISGERGEESANRARYSDFEPHRTDLRHGKSKRRYVDQQRPILHWTETEVWAIIEKYRINPHPVYLIGISRASCAACIFGDANQWATLKAYAPHYFEMMAREEEATGFTIRKGISIRQLADRGRPYPQAHKYFHLAMKSTYNEPIYLDHWTLPSGAFKKSCGPT